MKTALRFDWAKRDASRRLPLRVHTACHVTLPHQSVGLTDAIDRIVKEFAPHAATGFPVVSVDAVGRSDHPDFRGPIAPAVHRIDIKSSRFSETTHSSCDRSNIIRDPRQVNTLVPKIVICSPPLVSFPAWRRFDGPVSSLGGWCSRAALPDGLSGAAWFGRPGESRVDPEPHGAGLSEISEDFPRGKWKADHFTAVASHDLLQKDRIDRLLAEPRCAIGGD